MRWIFLSPHFDDVALSCGGLVWELQQAGRQVEICTICSEPPPSGPLSAFAQMLHARWATGGKAVVDRKAEDQAACEVLGAAWRYAGIPDCIYRPGGQTGLFYYATEESLFEDLHPGEIALTYTVAALIRAWLDADDQVVAPLAIGGHVDHRLTRRAAELLDRPLLYYADYPYRLKAGGYLESLPAQGWKTAGYPVSKGGLQAWQDSIEAHSSQISTFWPDLAAMRAAIHDLWEGDQQGVMLWKSPDWYEQIA